MVARAAVFRGEASVQMAHWARSRRPERDVGPVRTVLVSGGRMWQSTKDRSASPLRSVAGKRLTPSS